MPASPHHSEMDITQMPTEKSVLYRHIQFIQDMIEDMKGTAIERKWTMIMESIVNPKKKLAAEKIIRIDELINEIRYRESDKTNNAKSDGHLEPKTCSEDTSYYINSMSGIFTPKKDHNSSNMMSEHEPEIQDTSCIEITNDFDIRPKKKKSSNSVNVFNNSMTVVVDRAALSLPNDCAGIEENNRESDTFSQTFSEDIRDSKVTKNKSRFTEKSTREKSNMNPCKNIDKQISEGSGDDDDEFKGWDRSDVYTGFPFKCNDKTMKLIEILKTQPIATSRPAPLWKYQSTSNLAYARSTRAVIYKCLVQDCCFQTLVTNIMSKHLQTKHVSFKWNGYCNLCTKIIAGKTIMDEFSHMYNSHISPVLNVQQEKVWSTPAEIFELPSKSPSQLSTGSPLEGSKQSTIQIETETDEVMSKIDVSTTEQQLPAAVLQPWLDIQFPKSIEGNLLTTVALSATYKCMSSACIFYTNYGNLFRKHLAFHDRHALNDKKRCYLMCSYCEFSGKTAIELHVHIDSAHCHDRFQCTYCFYRSCNDFNVITHQLIYHKGQHNVLIKCKLIKPMDRKAELEMVKKSRFHNVEPIICVFCRGIFYAFDIYLQHVSEHSDNLRAKCIKCGLEATTRTIYHHLVECHGYGLYQCVYCKYGTCEFQLIASHIAHKHPSNIPMFYERVQYKNPDGSLKHPSPSIIEGICLKLIKETVSLDNIIDAPDPILRNENKVGKVYSQI